MKSAENNLMFSSCIAEVPQLLRFWEVLRVDADQQHFVKPITNTFTPGPKKSSHSHSVSTFLESWPQWMPDVMDLWETQTRTEHMEKSLSWNANSEPRTEAKPFKIAIYLNIYLQSTKAQKEIKQNLWIKNVANTLWSYYHPPPPPMVSVLRSIVQSPFW